MTTGVYSMLADGTRIPRVPSTGMSSDAERLDGLLEALRARERAAFTELYDVMAGQLTAFAHGLLGSRNEAEDVTQDVFLALIKHVKRFRGDGQGLLAWLYTSARNRCIDRQRKRSRTRESLVETPPDLAGGDDPQDLVFDAGSDVSLALAQLTEQQRTAIVLRRVVGFDGEEVGAILGIDREAVYALCARGERRLRALLAPPEAGPSDRASDERLGHERGDER